MGGDIKGGRTSATDDARFGKPSAVTCVKVTEQMDQHIRDNQRISIIEIICGQSWEEAAREWLKTQHKFYSDGMRTLVDCSIKKKLRGLYSASELYRPSDHRLSAKSVPTARSYTRKCVYRDVV
jgi:hypothetical protein